MITRRSILQIVSLLGISSPVFARALAQEATGSTELTKEMIAAAQWVSGIELTDEQQEKVLKEINSTQKELKALRAFALDPQNDIPGMIFETLAADQGLQSSDPISRNCMPNEILAGQRPTDAEQLAFLPLTDLAALVRSRQVTSMKLTQLYLARLKKFDPMLKCVVTYTEELAIKQAERADREIAQGKYRGPLHGIPWGAKDLMSVEGYPTTWGIPVFESRVINETATVAERLEAAGAVLIAKLSLGAIAMGDQWFRGMTRSPWNPKVGSSGSSAGSASATSAGLVGFAIGSETLGSIISPCTRCGTHGLRPTFGRVSRAGCMPLSWSMDKLGPLARSVEDLALVFGAIHGPDGKDPTVVNYPFEWPAADLNFRNLRVGIVPSTRENAPADESVEILKGLGCQVKEVKLPSEFPLRAMTNIIDVEGASVFNDLLRAGKTDGWNTWTETFQSAQFISALDYLRMQRVRRRLMVAFEELMRDVDVLWNARDLMHTNFTGHPSVVLPYKTAMLGEVMTPQSVVLTGHLYDESRLLAIAYAFQKELVEVLPNPPINDWLAKFEKGELDPKPNEGPGEKAEGDNGKKAEGGNKQANPGSGEKKNGGG